MPALTDAVPAGEAALLRRARDEFHAVFARAATVAAAAPGRVNIMGDHVDYCEGYVLPVALPFLTVMVGAPSNSGTCRVISVQDAGRQEASFPAPTADNALKPGEPAWANYVKGVVANFPGPVEGFNAVIVSDLPMGAGLSSSASIEVVTFTLLEALSGVRTEPVRKAQLCQKAEHEFPGMPCGIMDQYVVTMAKKDHALLIDCRSLESTQVPITDNDTAILVINTNVKHQLTGSEYPQRRAQCQEAADILGKPSLRGATVEQLEATLPYYLSTRQHERKTSAAADGQQVPQRRAQCQEAGDILGKPSLRGATVEQLEDLKRSNCDVDVVKRARHVIEEIRRSEEIVKCFKTRDWERVGELLYKSHDSLRNLMEVSCPELDALVEAARATPGVYGSRMTGGGFGGSVVVVVKKNSVEDLKKRVLSQYKGSPTFLVAVPSDGARIISI